MRRAYNVYYSPSKMDIILYRCKSALIKNNELFPPPHPPSVARPGRSDRMRERGIRINGRIYPRRIMTCSLHLRVKHAHQRCAAADKALLYHVTPGCKTNPRRGRPAGRRFTHYASRGAAFRRGATNTCNAVRGHPRRPGCFLLGAPITRLLLR